MLSLPRARSSMIFEARNSSRRWTIVSFSANLLTKIESSIAESPPPITATSLPLKKAPSQTPQVLTPRPCSSISPGMPRRLGSAPIARITARARWVSLPTMTSWTSPSVSFSSVTSSVMKRVPKRSACLRKSFIISGPMIPSG